MIEKPNISDEKIISALDESYGIQANVIEFLPIGNAPSAFAYRVEADDGSRYFLKLRKTSSNAAGVYVSRFLKDIGIEQVVAPLLTNTQELWASVDEFAFILYPFINGAEAMQVGMSETQWMEFGSILRRIHNTELSRDISRYVHREAFVPTWSRMVQELYKRANDLDVGDVYQRELAAFWKENNGTIQAVLEQTEAIGKKLQDTNLEFVLCHADIHTANVLLTPEDDMFIVDWDDTLLAPKERDLVFVLGTDPIPTREEQLFFHGYGEVPIKRLAVAYYRYEWCVQEIGDFGTQVFLTKDTGESVKQAALEGFRKLFLHDDVIELALSTPVEFL